MVRRVTHGEAENSSRDLCPAIAPTYGGVKLGPDPLSSLKFTNDASVLVIGDETAKEILKTAKDVASLVTSSTYLSAILPCGAAGGDQTCAGTFIDTYGPRIYRPAPTSPHPTELL